MTFTPLFIPDVVLIEPRLFGDDRGWFMESYNDRFFRQGLAELGLTVASGFVQDNHSRSQRGVLRGIHYQLPPRSQGKLVRVTRGAVFDVAVDLRRNSPTFGRWVGVTLTAENRLQLWVPPGFGHGFLALEDGTEFLYKTTDYFDKESERSIRWNDPTIAIDWPFSEGMTPVLAEKDAVAPLLEFAELF